MLQAIRNAFSLFSSTGGGFIASTDVASAIRANPSKWGLASSWKDWTANRARQFSDSNLTAMAREWLSNETELEAALKKLS